MKIQELAIIFILIILPISIIISEYTQFQIKTIGLQTEYDAKLTSATYDAIRAFQLNAKNSTTSDLANSRIRDLEASVNAFRNSIMSGFELNGYTEEELNNYVPALVYTLYDGFYIYSPYKNVVDETGQIIVEANSQESIYGLKPYINYSCRYKYDSNTDVVITYALDNYITVQGLVNGEYVNKSGYLVDNINVEVEENEMDDDSSYSHSVTYNGVKIESEQLSEYLPIAINGLAPKKYPYIKLNGTKYYYIEDYLLEKDLDGIENIKDCIVSVLNGKPIVQSKEGQEEFIAYKGMIMDNESAIKYYRDAKTFTDWFRDVANLDELEYQHAVDEIINEHGEIDIGHVWEGDDRPIFKKSSSVNIENQVSEFNQHRLAVIRHKIETNLAIAISNYNTYSDVTDNVFQMPELKEDEWENITKNISMISFLQGLYIGGKTYNGYAIVNNTESEEVVLEEDIYILGRNTNNNTYNYYKIGDKGLEKDGNVQIDAGIYGEQISAGRLKLDFQKKGISDYNLGYVEEGLIRHYEASNGYGFTDGLGQTTWIDLAGKKDGIVEGNPTLNEDKKCIELDGIDDWINLGETHSDEMTIEVVVEFPYDLPNDLKYTDNKRYILNNHQNGGIGILLYGNKIGHSTYFNEHVNKSTEFSKDITKNNKYYISLKYDGNDVILNLYDYTENKLEEPISIHIEGKLERPDDVLGNPTVMAIGANPVGNMKTGTCLRANVYSVRIYDRALGQEEVERNINTFKENMDDEIEDKELIKTSEGIYPYYPLREYNASYDSVVMQNNVTTYEDIYKYVSDDEAEKKFNNEDRTILQKAFYTALGRERYGAYKTTNTAMKYYNVLVVGTVPANYAEEDKKAYAKRIYNVLDQIDEEKEFNVKYVFNSNKEKIRACLEDNSINYNLVIADGYAWDFGNALVNQLNATSSIANLITMSNDEINLPTMIVNESRNMSKYVGNVSVASFYAKPEITDKGKQILSEDYWENMTVNSDSGQNAIKFKDGVDVLYKGTYYKNENGIKEIQGEINEFDLVGCWQNENNRWIHSQVLLDNSNKNHMNLFKELVKYALKIK